MDWLLFYILIAYVFILGSAAVGTFNRTFRANLLQRFSLLLFAIWAAWRIQLIWDFGYAWPHEPMVVTTLVLYTIGTIIKTRNYIKVRPSA